VSGLPPVFLAAICIKHTFTRAKGFALTVGPACQADSGARSKKITCLGDGQIKK
jgi:hypothetical protein